MAMFFKVAKDLEVLYGLTIFNTEKMRLSDFPPKVFFPPKLSYIYKNVKETI